jgi:hypothetical protein
MRSKMIGLFAAACTLLILGAAESRASCTVKHPVLEPGSEAAGTTVKAGAKTICVSTASMKGPWKTYGPFDMSGGKRYEVTVSDGDPSVRESGNSSGPKDWADIYWKNGTGKRVYLSTN